MVCDDSEETVRDVLDEKHPDVKPAHAKTIMTGSEKSNLHPVQFENIRYARSDKKM